MSSPNLVIGSERDAISRYHHFTALAENAIMGHPILAIPHQIFWSHNFYRHRPSIRDNKRSGRDAKRINPEENVFLANVKERVLIGRVFPRLAQKQLAKVEVLFDLFGDVLVVRLHQALCSSPRRRV